MNSSNSILHSDICAIHLAPKLEDPITLKWIAEMSKVIKELGVLSFAPGRIGRTEPILRHAGTKVIELPLDKTSKRASVQKLTELATTNDAQVYICYDLSMLALAKSLTLTNEATIILVVQDYVKRRRKSRIFKEVNPFLGVNYILTPSKAITKQLQNDWIIPNENIRSIPEGIDTSSISDTSISQARTYGLANAWAAIDNPTQIAMMNAQYSNDVWKKNVLMLAEEWSKASRPSVNFVMVGDDGGSGELNRLSSALTMKYPKVQFQAVGHCADIEAAIKLSTCFIELPNDKKPMHQTALIAQAIGRFVIMPDEQSAYDFLPENLGSGAITSNIKEITKYVQEVLDKDESQRRTIAMAGRNFINQNYTPEIMHAKLNAVFADGDAAPIS